MLTATEKLSTNNDKSKLYATFGNNSAEAKKYDTACCSSNVGVLPSAVILPNVVVQSSTISSLSASMFHNMNISSNAPTLSMNIILPNHITENIKQLKLNDSVPQVSKNLTLLCNPVSGSQSAVTNKPPNDRSKMTNRQRLDADIEYENSKILALQNSVKLPNTTTNERVVNHTHDVVTNKPNDTKGCGHKQCSKNCDKSTNIATHEHSSDMKLCIISQNPSS